MNLRFKVNMIRQRQRQIIIMFLFPTVDMQFLAKVRGDLVGVAWPGGVVVDLIPSQDRPSRCGERWGTVQHLFV